MPYKKPGARPDRVKPAAPSPKASKSDKPKPVSSAKPKATSAAKPKATSAAKPKATSAAKPKAATAAKPKAATAAKPKAATAAKPKVATAAKPKVANVAKPKALAQKPPTGTILSKPGIPWVVKVDGDDLLVEDIRATCFGGAFDDGDNGETESGVDNSGIPKADAKPMGVALPIRSTEASTKKSPLAFSGPHIPWKSTVNVWRKADGEGTAVKCILIDNGPDVSRFPANALDLNPNVALHFSPNFDPKKVANHWSETGFSYRIVGGAKYVS